MTILTADEIHRVTEYTQPAKQCEALAKLGIALPIVDGEKRYLIELDEKQYNRARLCALACAGIPDSHLSNIATGALCDIEHGRITYWDKITELTERNAALAQQLAASEQQRGELVEALQKSLSSIGKKNDGDFYAMIILEEALAKVGICG